MSEVQPLSGNWLNERTHLRKSLRRVDVTFYLLCTLVGLDTIGSVAANGPQGLVWMVILAVVFFLPYGFLTTELGTAFPIEGGPYVWTKLAFGRMAAGVNQVLYWLSNPLWMGGTLAIIAVDHVRDVLPGAGSRGQVHRGPRVHLDRRSRRRRVPANRQVGPHRGRVRPDHPAGLLHDLRRGLRDQERRATVGRRGLRADVGRFRRTRARADLQLRGLRTAVDRDRGDDRPAEDRAVRDPARRLRRVPAVRRADSGDPAGGPGRADPGAGRVHRRREAGPDRVRRICGR